MKFDFLNNFSANFLLDSNALMLPSNFTFGQLAALNRPFLKKSIKSAL